MSDFVSDFWSPYIAIVTVISILGCALLLWMQSSAKHVEGKTTGHVWDETLEELSNPLPSWWRWLFYLTVIFSLFYLAMYPGLGSFKGQYQWTSTGQYDQEMKKADEGFGPIFQKYLKQDVRVVAANPAASEMGQRLFLTYCAQCHGSDARGTKGFPNLADKDWLFGGSPEQIKESIAQGRVAMMPAKGVKPDLTGDEIKDIAHHVRSLSGLAADPLRIHRGKQLFSVACAACHGAEGTGSVGLAPNLADKVWLYGSSEATIIESISNGRSNHMPAFGDFLGEAKVHLLTAYVYGLGGGQEMPVTTPADNTLVGNVPSATH